MNIEFSELKFLMKSLNFNIEGPIDFNLTNWKYDDKFKCILAPKVNSIAPDYIYVSSEKKTRGRKPKKKNDKKLFKSNITFIRRLDIHRIPKKDKYSKTATICEEHINCEIIKKDYSIVLFNNHKGICTGILHEDNSDFNICINDLINYLTEKYIEIYYLLELPPIFYTYIRNTIKDKYIISNINSTIENYQFNIITSGNISGNKYFINLHNLKSFFIDKSKVIVEINYEKLFDFLTRLITESKYDFDVNTIMENLIDPNEKNHKVCKNKFIDILSEINLKSIEIDFYDKFWHKYKDNIFSYAPSVYEKNYLYVYLKQYIIYRLNYIRESLNILEYYLVDKVRFMYDKNTLIIKKNKITVRFFNTGIINIQGAKSRELAYAMQQEIYKIFKDCADKIIYLPDTPPMVSYKDIINTINF